MGWDAKTRFEDPVDDAKVCVGIASNNNPKNNMLKLDLDVENVIK